MDPITAIAAATTAFNAIKKGFSVGRDVESMSKDLGRWMGAIQDVKDGHKKSKGRSFGSVEEEALETFAAKKKAEQMERELRNFVNLSHGPSAWNEVIRIQADIRLKKKEAIAEAKKLRAKRIENIILGVLVLFFLGAVGAVLYLVLMAK
jgi:molecular chaperone GrpE (heat shock protein)|tara:strand:+ start:865 stop:1314 length:450 start_codon:yes stop_codon:yes gene_type:complete